MALSKQLFRESALERLSSPEQLDQLLRVTSPQGWVALIALWVLLGSIVAWSILGTAPTKEEGRGILVTGGGLKQVVASGTGRLRAIGVRVDDVVSEGDIVAIIDRQDLVEQMNDASSRLAELRAQQVSLDEFDAREKELQAGLGGVEKRRLERTIEFSRDRLERLRSRRGVVDRLVSEGMMIEVDREKVDEEIEGTLVAIQQAELEIEQRTAKERNADFQRERDALNRRLQGDEVQRKVAMIKSRLERESEVRSPFAGRIVEVRAAVQSAIAVGDPILLVEPSGAARGELEAILYVSAATGKRIQRGMDVDLSPSTVKPEEFGALRGRVSSIAEVPTSKSAMMAVLSDVDMVEKFSREIGLPLEMRVSLTPDTSTPSGYKWSSSQGPPIRISAGTLCSGSVTVRRQSPLSLVIPLARRQLDAD